METGLEPKMEEAVTEPYPTAVETGLEPIMEEDVTKLDSTAVETSDAVFASKDSLSLVIMSAVELNPPFTPAPPLNSR